MVINVVIPTVTPLSEYGMSVRQFAVSSEPAFAYKRATGTDRSVIRKKVFIIVIRIYTVSGWLYLPKRSLIHWFPLPAKQSCCR
jgi:hypothetical protein